MGKRIEVRIKNGHNIIFTIPISQLQQDGKHVMKVLLQLLLLPASHYFSPTPSSAFPITTANDCYSRGRTEKEEK